MVWSSRTQRPGGVAAVRRVDDRGAAEQQVAEDVGAQLIHRADIGRATIGRRRSIRRRRTLTRRTLTHRTLTRRTLIPGGIPCRTIRRRLRGGSAGVFDGLCHGGEAVVDACGDDRRQGGAELG
ncbi:MAG: hypothetical protein K0S70_3519, partial [Microbacterium sp.]|nr:hypothetical protein [Microbacterium sp.]